MSEDKKLNEVIRVQKRSHGFVMIDKGFLENDQLSWKAKGILAYLLSKPDNWKVITRDLVKHSTDGKTAVYGGLSELQKQGYYNKKPIRSENGRRISHWESTIYECPMESLENTEVSLLSDFQEVDNQDIDNQFIENPVRNNNYINNNKYNNNHSSLVLSEQEGGQDKGQDRSNDVRCQIESYLGLLKDNIGYSDFLISHPDDVVLLDEFISIMLDVIMSKGEYVRINGEEKPRELVKHNLLRIDHRTMEHALGQFKSVTERIAKKKQYIIALLYNSKMEFDSHYTNLVNHDLWG